MSTKFFFRTALAALLLAVSVATASAQNQTVSGKVTIRQADGTEAPVTGAVVDIYQTDTGRKFLGIKTNNKGEYTHAGIPVGGNFIVAASAPGASPTFYSNLRLSSSPVQNFVLEPGDGKRLTLDDIKAAGSKGGGPSAAGTPAAASGGATAAPVSKEDKAKAAEAAKERARIEEENKKISGSNEVVARTFKAGNEALNAGRYDEAIASYDEGLAAREEVALYANRSEALRRRGVERYNAAIQNKDATQKSAGLEVAYKDWRDAAESSAKALAVASTQTAAADPAAQANQAQNKMAALSTRAEAMRLVASKVDRTQVDAAMTAYQEYLAATTDPVKKSKLQTDAAKMLFDAGAYDRAVAEYRKILEAEPDNPDANLYLGFSLFNTGDKAKFQEAANFIGRFVEKAPETNAMKGEAKSILEFLKTQENIKPERVPTRATGRRKG